MSEHSGDRSVAPYGSWQSPIATDMLTAGALRFDELDVDGDDLYWVESRPDEQGRYAAMRLSDDGELSEITTAQHSARTLVHEYGGGSLAVGGDYAFFSNFTDQRLYRRRIDGCDDPVPITPALAVRYADATVDVARGRLICVAEDHRREDLEAENYLTSIPIDGSAWRPRTSFGCTRDSISAPLHGSVRMGGVWRGSVGITPTCPGTQPNCG